MPEINGDERRKRIGRHPGRDRVLLSADCELQALYGDHGRPPAVRMQRDALDGLLSAGNDDNRRVVLEE